MNKIIVEPYNEIWKEEFIKIKKELLKVLKDNIISIEHVGSTSITGMWAKPIIDIDIVIDDEKLIIVIEKIASIGYIHEGNLGICGREAFKYDPKTKPLLMNHHLYVCHKNSYELQKHISLRNLLNQNAYYREKYSETKKEMAQKYPYDINKYLEGKEQVINEIYCLCGLDIKKNQMTISIISDPQIDLTQSSVSQINLLKKCFSNIDSDITLVCGDISENATVDEWKTFNNLYIKQCKNSELLLIPGNMDKTLDNNREAFLNIFRKGADKLYFTKEYDNCIVFGLTIENDSDEPLSNIELKALNNALHLASIKKIPAIVFGHYILNDTINVDWKYAYLGQQSQAVKDLFENCGTKVLYFSGHIHRGLIYHNGGSVIEKNNVTYISTPSICYPDKEHYITDNSDLGTGYKVTIYNDKITINGYDYVNNQLIHNATWEIMIK